jgi:hypothetical protein
LIEFFGCGLGQRGAVEGVSVGGSGRYVSTRLHAPEPTTTVTHAHASAEPDGSVHAAARVTLFGFDSTEAIVRLRPRGRRWRLGRAAGTMGVFVVIALIVAIVPPHAPWGIGALVGGMILARRRMIERFTLLEVKGTCPNCTEALDVRSARLRAPHPVTCEACHHQSSLKFPTGSLKHIALE